MTASIVVNKPAHADTHLGITWALIAGLFILRIPLATGMNILAPETHWVGPVFQVGTYFLTALLIWWERNRLAEFHIDRLALVIFILGKPVEFLLYRLQIPYAYPPHSPALILYLPIAFLLAVALLVARPALPKRGRALLSWVFVGILTGIALGVYSGGIIQANMDRQGNPGPVTWTLLLFLPLQQMVYAGVAEEPFFRGFLWGGLRKLGLNEGWVWVIQGCLFWLGHLYYLFHNVEWSFLFLVPVASFVLGLLVWRSRSIAVTMIAHGLTNGLGQIVGYYL